jgi:hypothetical protein
MPVKGFTWLNMAIIEADISRIKKVRGGIPLTQPKNKDY